MNRKYLQEVYITHVIDETDMEGLLGAARAHYEDEYAAYSDEELLEEINMFAPHLLKEDN